MLCPELLFIGNGAGRPTVSRVEAATAADDGQIRVLLGAAGLPTDDLAAAKPEFMVVRSTGQVVAAGALEHYGSAALLRSVVVASDWRSQGLGQLLIQALERAAARAGVVELILLTQTAADFFARLGFRVIAREGAPSPVQQSAEFRALCPSTATCMAKGLGTGWDS